MNKKKILLIAAIVLLVTQFIYTAVYVVLVQKGGPQYMKLQIGTKGEAMVQVWAPYGFINDEGDSNKFLRFIYSPFYSVEQQIYPGDGELVDDNEVNHNKEFEPSAATTAPAH